jgi:hypothetical protein
MEISDQDMAETLIGYDVFRIATGDKFAPYATPEVSEANLSLMVQWAAANLPNGLYSLREMGGWELAFRACVGELDRDPLWRSAAQKKADFVKEYDSLSVAEVKERTAKDPAFRASLASMDQK